jgi:hypothetical protein
MLLVRATGLLVIIFTLTAVLSDAQESTFYASNGNHLVPGKIDLKQAAPVKIKLSSYPTWVTGHDDGSRSVWYVLLNDSTVRKVVVEENGKVSVSKTEFSVPSDTILSIDTGSNPRQLFAPALYKNNFVTPPVRLIANNKIAAIDGSSWLSIQDQDIMYRLKIDPLRDSRILQNEKGQILVLTEGSKKYRHGILGDTEEAGGFAIIDADKKPVVRYEFSLTGSNVFETLMPVWTDINLDNKREIILTKSDARSGAQLQIYTEDGRLISSSDPIGKGFRWMHLIAAADFGPGGEIEIAAVRTPHIGGVLEYFRLDDEKLRVVHKRAGYSTHRIGSRNLDTAVAGDFNNDGHVEILVPTQDFKQLDSIKRTAGGSKIVHSIKLDDQLSTNLAAYSSHGKIKIAFGTFNNELIIILQ